MLARLSDVEKEELESTFPSHIVCPDGVFDKLYAVLPLLDAAKVEEDP